MTEGTGHTRALHAGALLLALLGLVPVANLLTAGREVVWWRGALIIWLAYGGLLLAVLWVASERWGDALDRLSSGVAARIMRVPNTRFTVAASALTVIVASFVALYCYAGRGFTADEMAMAWHARMLLAGHLAIPTPAHPEFFDTAAMMTRGPRWYSQYPIGGPALLALGLALRAVWLVNPLLLGVATWQLHRFVRRAFDEPTARAATILFALTPFVLVLGATQMNHTAALALTLVALAELAAWDQAEERRAQLGHAMALGASVSAIALARPFDAVLVAIPIGLFQLARTVRAPRRAVSLAAQVAAGLVPLAILFWANARTAGSPLLFAYDAANGPAHGIGFHLDPNGEMHTPLRGLVHVSGYLMRFNRFLFEWPIPALLVVSGVLLALRRGTRWDSLLLGIVASFLVGYWAYWGTAFFDGPRFLLPIAPILVLYAARAPEAAARFAHPSRRRVARVLVPACVLCAWLVPVSFTSVPARLSAMRDQRTKLKADVAGQVREATLTNALVLVREPWRGRLLARLRAIGVGQFEAERLVNVVDACALQLALDETDSSPPADEAVRRMQVAARAAAAGPAAMQPGLSADNGLAFAAPPTAPRCRDELMLDSLGTMPYAMFLRDQRVERSGKLGGPVVFVRDLGARDTLLRAEYGGRRWYLYKPGVSLEARPTFVPVPVP